MLEDRKITIHDAMMIPGSIQFNPANADVSAELHFGLYMPTPNYKEGEIVVNVACSMRGAAADDAYDLFKYLAELTEKTFERKGKPMDARDPIESSLFPLIIAHGSFWKNPDDKLDNTLYMSPMMVTASLFKNQDLKKQKTFTRNIASMILNVSTKRGDGGAIVDGGWEFSTFSNESGTFPKAKIRAYWTGKMSEELVQVDSNNRRRDKTFFNVGISLLYKAADDIKKKFEEAAQKGEVCTYDPVKTPAALYVTAPLTFWRKSDGALEMDMSIRSLRDLLLLRSTWDAAPTAPAVTEDKRSRHLADNNDEDIDDLPEDDEDDDLDDENDVEDDENEDEDADADDGDDEDEEDDDDEDEEDDDDDEDDLPVTPSKSKSPAPALAGKSAAPEPAPASNGKKSFQPTSRRR